MAYVRFKGGRVKRHIRMAIADGMEASGNLIVYHLRKNLNTPFPPASSPGEFPHRRSGDLRRACYYRMNRTTLELKILVKGDIAEYWGFLEFGTEKMAPRPFISPTMKQLRPRLAKVVQKTANASLRAMR